MKLDQPMSEHHPSSSALMTSSSSSIPIALPSSNCSHPNLGSTSSKSSSSSQKDHFDIVDYKKLNRGISRAADNEKIVSQARSEIALIDNTEETNSEQFIDSPVYTFTLPDITQYPDDFRKFLEKDLIALSTQVSLEESNRLNWWTSVTQKLYPLSTSGDGNCLLHAASLGIWGFHDRLLTLRKALHVFLSQSPRREALWRRWKYQQSKLNEQSGLVYSELEWRREWNAIVSMASTIPRLRRQSIASNCDDATAGAVYESLEEIHVLSLAHVLRRPIIVVADTILKDSYGEALAPIPFGGIYLPLECPPDICQKSPLLLAFDGGHFSALVAMDNNSNPEVAAIPLVDNNHELLPIQFNVDPGDSETEIIPDAIDNVNLLAEYLEVLKLDSNAQQYATSSDCTDGQKNGLFGSLGRSVGHKLRLKLTRTNSMKRNENNKKSNGILCGLLYTKNRTEYQDELIENYLKTAKLRFEQNLNDANTFNGPRHGVGKSQFYTSSDIESHQKISSLTPIKSNTNNDNSTMYLSKSTFYTNSNMEETSEPARANCKTNNCIFYVNPNSEGYCSKCYQNVLKANS